jgi:hypothetical protein
MKVTWEVLITGREEVGGGRNGEHIAIPLTCFAIDHGP